MTVFDEDYLRIEADDHLNAIILYWKSTPSSHKLRKGLNRGLEELVLRKYSYWIENITKRITLGLEDQVWINGIWLPQSVSKGVRSMAIVLSTDIFGQNGIEEIVGKPKIYKGFESKYFPNMEAGKAWISTSNLNTLV
jgi:hypothetical protein